jgi:hypothetical protein
MMKEIKFDEATSTSALCQENGSCWIEVADILSIFWKVPYVTLNSEETDVQQILLFLLFAG